MPDLNATLIQDPEMCLGFVCGGSSTEQRAVNPADTVHKQTSQKEQGKYRSTCETYMFASGLYLVRARAIGS